MYVYRVVPYGKSCILGQAWGPRPSLDDKVGAGGKAVEEQAKSVGRRGEGVDWAQGCA